MDDNPFHATTGSLWRTSFVLDDPDAQLAFERLDEAGLSVGMFEHEGDGGFVVERWRLEIVEAVEPEHGVQHARLRAMIALEHVTLADLTIVEITEAEWTAALRQEFPPVDAGRFFVHGRAQADDLPDDRIGIEIEAGLAFGSGEHATTKGCLLVLDRVARLRPIRHVLDMGTGSGILAIGAAKLGAMDVLAVDVDETAVEVAAANVADNGVADVVTCRAGDGFHTAGVHRPSGYDLIFANILARPLIAMAHDLARSLKPGGTAILAGLIDDQAPMVEAAYRRAGLRTRRRLVIDRWVIVSLRRPR